jgi:hypothetical protein
MKLKLISLILLTTILFGSGAYDHGTSAGKAKWDISLTWNPFNYFKDGQTYAVFGYGLTNKLDVHAYYSAYHNGGNNYYGGLFYQFLNSKYLDLATAVGIRAYTDKNLIHLFMPQLLYTLKLTEKLRIGGSIVNIRNKNLNTSRGKTVDCFLMLKVYEHKKYSIDFTVGAFNPVLWEPEIGDWYPTYSIDIKIKN